MSAVEITRPSLAENLLYYRAHPPAFVRDHLGAEPDPWQEEVLPPSHTSRRSAS